MKLSKKYLILTSIVTILAIAINVYIIIHSCLNGTESAKASQGVTSAVEQAVETVTGNPNTINESNYASFATFVRKAFGHFGLFMINGLLTPWAIYLLLNPLKSSRYWMLITYSLEFGLLVALITEMIQLNVPGRSGEPTDVLIDYGGYLVGALIIGLILFLVIRKKNKNRQKNAEIQHN